MEETTAIKMRIEALADFVVLRFVDSEDKIGSVFVPDNLKRPRWFVHRIGPLVKSVVAGEEVFTGAHSGDPIMDADGVVYKVVQEKEILAVLRRDDSGLEAN